ncbi:MAG: hypothetical protein E6K80_02540 [Candidatus Eisenbacteria bacterium]|uniref:DUF1579 domain-containing protein n=1 Tax=Eiseniibacteriota bacterium TaxID=2212470 RepID=A0A538U9F7_UNCEI|nr:MAG: hypothetical protein E6K80_02540 [Candidatus Eisenbacteria bacterium]
MRWRATVLCVALLAQYRPALAQDSPPGQDTISAKRVAGTSFDVLKGLAGSWTGSVTTDPHNPDIEGPIQVTMRVASRGSLLEHEIAPGGVPEPSMIYVEGDRLTLVHYCEAGNRPRLVARSPADSKTVDFEFADISGSTMPVYLQHFVFTIVSADHHTEDWTFQLPEEKQLHAHFDLKRATESAHTAAGKVRARRH